ncbi:MAG: phosphoserine aminotransferase [Candidatus Bathyarchaeota archaeon BA1]|nr:MAG: phosphoserine aminotransferase [Candidatus Bathyarchaeota archaeon BA1]
MIPGPTNVDFSVLRALSKPTMSHMSTEFVGIFKKSIADLKKVFMTHGDVLIVAGSGTLAMEMALANVIEPGDKTLNLVSGFFGRRFIEISKYHRAVPTILEAPWGGAVKPDMVKDALQRNDYKAVTVVHVDTSTGVANPIKEIGEVVKDHSDALYIVDAVCSLGGMEIRVDDWQIDICLTASQKCIGAPPGLALLAVHENAMKFIEAKENSVGFYYGSFKNWLPVMRDPALKYFATLPVNMIYALCDALNLVLSEGLERRFKRHHVSAEALRAAMDALNLKTVADRKYAADTVTAIYYPENVEDQAFRNGMKKRGVIVAGGLGPLTGKGFRVGHMGNVNLNDIMSTVGAMEVTLRDIGYHFEHGAGLKAAQEKFSSLER